MESTIFELRVKEIIAETLGVDLERVEDTADIIDDLEADSIQVLDLIIALENEFNISISDSDVINNRIVEDVTSFIVNHR
ncbi:MAG: acyl carrier protein [Ruminococcaceae bacterium]|nr:acyl carrier protein [Oscillospiraceae bacterium]